MYQENSSLRLSYLLCHIEAPMAGQRPIYKIATLILTTLFVVLSVAVVQGTAEQEETELFLVAQKAFDDGFYDVAVRYINQFIEQYPLSQKRIEANLLLGQCYFFQSQYLKAYNIFQSLLPYPEHNDATLFWLGETYLKGSDYHQAENQYQQLIEKYPESLYSPQAYYSWGWSLFEQQKYDAAKETFLKFIKLFADHLLAEDTLLKIGECAYNSLQYEEALNHFKDYVTRFPQSPHHDQAYFYIGESYFYLENYPDAITYYTKASDISRDDKIIFMSKVSIGWSYLKLSEFHQSQKFFDEAKYLSQQRDMPADEILLGQATLYGELNDYQKALDTYNQLMDNFPQSPRIAEAHLGRANTLYLLEQYTDSINEYNQVLVMFSTDSSLSEIVEKARFGLAWSYLKQNSLELAIKNFEEIMNQTKSKVIKVSALTQMGDAYQDSGNFNKALEIYDKIVRDYPQSPYTDYIQYRQGITLLKMGKVEAATISLQSLKTNFPESKYLAEADYYLGVAYFKKEDWAAAKEQMERFVKAMPATDALQPEANYILALCTFNLRDPEKAIKIFQKIINNYPEKTDLVNDSEVNIAKCLYELGQDKEALKKFKIIIYKYPESPIALESMLWLGDFYLKSLNFDNAILYYQQILDHFPGSEKIPKIRFLLSEAYQQSGQFDKALNQLKLIDQKDNRELYAKAQLAIADIFSRKVDSKTAIEQYENIVTSCPEFARDANAKIARIYQANRETTRAMEYYHKALKAPAHLSPLKNAEILFLIGDLYEALNDSHQALEAYFKIPYLYPKDVDWSVKAYLRVARIFEDGEDWENAKLAYTKIMEYGTEEVKFAQERLSWIEQNAVTTQHE